MFLDVWNSTFFILRVWGMIQKKSKKLFHWTYIRKRSRHFCDNIICFNAKQEFYWKHCSWFVFIKDCLPSFVKTEIGSSLSNEQTPDSFRIASEHGFSLHKISPCEINRENTNFISFLLYKCLVQGRTIWPLVDSYLCLRFVYLIMCIYYLIANCI